MVKVSGMLKAFLIEMCFIEAIASFRLAKIRRDKLYPLYNIILSPSTVIDEDVHGRRGCKRMPSILNQYWIMRRYDKTNRAMTKRQRKRCNPYITYKLSIRPAV